MRGDELRQWIRSSSAFAHVVVIESLDTSDLGQMLFPILHPRMRRRCSCARSKQEQAIHTFSPHPARQIRCAACDPPSSGKKSRYNVGNKIHQTMSDHVRNQVATPQIECG